MIGGNAPGLMPVRLLPKPLAAFPWEVLTGVALLALAAVLVAVAVARHRPRLAWPAIWLVAGAVMAFVFGPVYGLAVALLALAPAPGHTWRS